MSDPNPFSPEDSNRIRRRTWMGVASMAALSGLAVGVWRSTREEDAPPESSVSALVVDFWSQTWNAPDGRTLQMSEFRGHPLLLNFWATWCPPCVDELPLINAFYRQNKANGWQVLGLAIDKPLSVQKFLKTTPLDFPVGLAAMGGPDLGRSLGNVAGGLPFSVVIGSDGQIIQRKMGRLSPENLEAWSRLK